MEAIPELVDRVAGSIRQALRDGGGADGGGKASAVTQNLEAYRHYLLGQQFANETFDIPAAIAEYKAAIAADSGFAMPHLEMAILAGWHDAPDEDQRTHMAAASRNAGRLPDKERRLVLGYTAFVEQRYPEATRILDALALDYPLDKQVLYRRRRGLLARGHARRLRPCGQLLPRRPRPRPCLSRGLHPPVRVARSIRAEGRGAGPGRAGREAPSLGRGAGHGRAGARRHGPLAGRPRRGAGARAHVSGGEHFESAYAQAEVLFGAGERAEAERRLRRWLVPDVSPGTRRVAAEVLAPLLALQGQGP